MSGDIARLLETLVFRNRPLVLGLFVGVTVLLAIAAAQLRIDASFAKQIPLDHPYMRTLLEYRAEFGGGNRLLIAVRARDGDILDPHFLTTLEEVTDAVFFLPGVDRSTVRSIFTPNVRFVEIVEGGFVGGRVVPADFRPTPGDITRVRANILKADIVGRLVADDFSAAMVQAELIERGPSGELLDELEVARHLERLRARFADDAIDLHIIGFAKLAGEIADGARAVLWFFAVAFVATALLVYAFLRSVRLAFLPLVCSVVAVVWTLGLLGVLGFGLDPMSVLLPFLVFAIAVSHGVQITNAARTGIADGLSGLDAARDAFRRLLVPGGIALFSDLAGFLTILLIDIGTIRELAVTASLGMLAIIATNLVLLPVLLSYITPAADARHSLWRARWWRPLSRLAERRFAAASLATALGLLLVGLIEARGLAIGDRHAGVPELRPEARYNQDLELIGERFAIGVDVLKVIVETVPDGCVAFDVMAAIDRFAWHMANLPGVRSTASLPQMARALNAGLHEGDPRWRVLPRDPRVLAQAVAPVETASGLLNQDCSVMPVLIFTEDHRAETIAAIVDAVKAHKAASDAERHTFRLAMGNVGVMAATNEVIARAQLPMLLWIYGAVSALCLLAFRSLGAVLCIVLPLGLVSVLVFALMSALGIGLKVSTLPVAALGVGIGVDYGIYMFAQLKARLGTGRPFADALGETFETTGSAVLLTGLALTAGVATWLFSPLQFQADMGLLLAFMFLANMLGALCLLPALAAFLYRDRHDAARS